jgi:prolipoprotein diacylglyceryltransferase
MLPTLQIGPLALQTPGLVIILGLWIGLTLAERISPEFKANPNVYFNLALTVMISGILGARLIYAARYLDVFKTTPLNLFSLNPGLTDPIGGIGAGIVAALIFINRKKMSIALTLSAFTPLFAVMMVALGLSQLASGDAYGIETSLPWGIEIWGAIRHPTQIYYSLTSLAILIIIWSRYTTETVTEKNSLKLFITFISLSASSRLFLDAFRENTNFVLGGIRTSQIVSWIVLALSLWALLKIRSVKYEMNGVNNDK